MTNEEMATQIARIEERLTARSSLTDALFAESKDAITRADKAVEKRFDNVNEFRNTLSDQAATFITRDVSEAQIGLLRNRVDALSTQVTQLLITLLVSLVGVLVSALIYLATRS